jgi:hypothetical protein
MLLVNMLISGYCFWAHSSEYTPAYECCHQNFRYLWVPSALNDFYMLAKQPDIKQIAYTTIKYLRIVFIVS